MCLITEQQKPFIAEKDITVYKVLGSDRRSPFLSTMYEEGKLYKTKISKSTEVCCFDNTDGRWLTKHYPGWDAENSKLPSKLKCFGKGFHSAQTIERLSCGLSLDEYIFKCTLPIGSRYYLDATQLCISNQIIVHDMIPNQTIVHDDMIHL